MARRQRDYRAEYRARVERAKAQGLSIRQATGHASRGRVALPSITELRATGRLPAARPRTRVPKITDLAAQIADRTGTSRLVQSSSERELMAQLRRAADLGQSVSFRATWDTDEHGYKTVALGATKRHPKLTADGRPVGKVQMTVGRDPSGSGQSIPARDILDALDAGEFGDIWEWFAAMLADGEDWY